MSCLPPDSLFSVLGEISLIRRPRLLLRTARFGLRDYNRETDLRRILRLPATPRPGNSSLRQLLELEAQQEAQRTRPPQDAGNPWRPARHIEVLIALMAETRLLATAIDPRL